MIGICGCGYSVPPHVRSNDDPLFHFITRNANSQGVVEADLFTGLKERRFLKKGERLEVLMVEAAQQALAQAGLEASRIDRLYGYASVSPYLTPNALYVVHYALRLSPEAMVVPINSEFSNFVLSMLHAWEAIMAGHCTYALVVCGANWTQHMDYTQGHALSIGDGAGAVVIGPSRYFTLVDYAVQTRSEQYGVMRMRLRPVSMGDQPYLPLDENNIPRPTYEITPEQGIHSFQASGMEGPPALVKDLLQKHRLSGDDIALISHQASRMMMDYWASCIRPGAYLETLASFGNMTLATYPVNLAYFIDQIATRYLVIVAIGPGFHQAALLLKRMGSE